MFLTKKLLIFGLILIILAGIAGGCTRPDGTVPVLTTNKPAPNGSGVYMTFQHTQPGVYSEVFVTVYGLYGDNVSLKLTGPAVTPPEWQSERIEADGSVTFHWKITRYGTYDVNGTINYDQRFNASIVVK